MGSSGLVYEKELNLKATELRLGLPGTEEEEHETLSGSSVKSNKRASESKRRFTDFNGDNREEETCPSAKSQIVGWPPVRSSRKNKIESEGSGIYVKVSKDGAAYLRKIDLRMYKGYTELLKALESMFMFKAGEYSEREGYKGSDFVPTYEDKDGDWMLVGDVPWDMFMCSCKRLRIMRGSEARGLNCGL